MPLNISYPVVADALSHITTVLAPVLQELVGLDAQVGVLFDIFLVHFIGESLLFTVGDLSVLTQEDVTSPAYRAVVSRVFSRSQDPDASL